ncbi:uncharacterized protein METZ01_LOCUS439043 [marine metagenome]|uniref:Uncharacterized protein n=1 Tax=marine metagenome TaxID=408172 RepID=A0A382YTB3_9ZZZZ
MENSAPENDSEGRPSSISTGGESCCSGLVSSTTFPTFTLVE